MKHNATKYLYDILDTIEKIEYHITKTSTIVDFINDITVVHAVERCLGIIGEALSQIEKINKEGIGEIIQVTEQKRIITLRHILVHDYDLIDRPTLWRITQQDLAILKRDIEQLIKNRQSPIENN